MTVTDGLEEVLRENYCSYRRTRGKKKIYIEVPVFSRSVDLVEFDGHSRKITAVEFKINDWKRAIKQLSEISLCFDFLVLCVPKPKTSKCIENIKSSCAEKGMGLILWDQSDNSFTKICEPIEASDIWKEPKRQIIKYLKDKEVYHG